MVVVAIYAICRRASGEAPSASEGCRLLVLQPNIAAALHHHGPATILENHYSDYPQQITLLDPSGFEDLETVIGDNVRVISWKKPVLEKFLLEKGLQSTGEMLGVMLTSERLIRFLSRSGDNVVRCIIHDRTALFGLVASRALRLPYIIEVAGNYELMQRLLQFTYYFGNFYRFKWLRPPVKAFSNWLLGIPLRCATRVIGRNKNNYEHAFALGADVDRLSLVRIRISERFFDESRIETRSLSRPMDGRYLLYVARLAPEKRPLDAFDIFERVAAELDDVNLVIIGDGPLMPAVQAAREKSRYADRIKILGSIPNSGVVVWSRYAAIGLELYSGSSLVEKMSCGIPVVAYDVEWMSEVIIDGYSGYTADFLDTQGMAERCLTLLNNPEEAARLGEQARVLAKKIFNRHAIIVKEDGYLRKIVRDRYSSGTT